MSEYKFKININMNKKILLFALVFAGQLKAMPYYLFYDVPHCKVQSDELRARFETVDAKAQVAYEMAGLLLSNLEQNPQDLTSCYIHFLLTASDYGSVLAKIDLVKIIQHGLYQVDADADYALELGMEVLIKNAIQKFPGRAAWAIRNYGNVEVQISFNSQRLVIKDKLGISIYHDKDAKILQTIFRYLKQMDDLKRETHACLKQIKSMKGFYEDLEKVD